MKVMVSKTYSLREAINILKQNRDKLEIKVGKSKIERLLFNLEEINIDIETIASQIVDVATEEASLEQLPKIFDFFQYGSIPHILGHLETIEEILENNQNNNETFNETANLKEAVNKSRL